MIHVTISRRALRKHIPAFSITKTEAASKREIALQKLAIVLLKSRQN